MCGPDSLLDTWVLLICFGLECSTLPAQSNAPNLSPQPSRQSLGPFDKDIVIPDAKGPLGQRDSGASNELLGHLAVVGTSPWTGMVGTGQITYGTTDSTAYSATLSILGGTGFRLDSQTSRGALSIRISGRHGIIQEPDGRQFPILPDTAATGIFQFVQPRLPNIPGATGSLLDRGPIVVDSVSLHRVTIESPGAGHDLVTGKATIIATDLYFDPSTHLLVKSANSIGLDGAHNNHLLRVITYGDYRKVGNSMVPFLYTQTLDGQKQWTLQLTDVQLNPTLDSTIFEF